MANELGITGPQRFVLRVLELAPKISSGALAEYLHLHPSTLTGVLQRLERRKLLVRRRDPNDARRVLLELTPAGRRVLKKRTASVEAVVRAVISRERGKQIDTAVEVLQRITSALETAASP